MKTNKQIKLMEKKSRFDSYIRNITFEITIHNLKLYVSVRSQFNIQVWLTFSVKNI